MIGQLSWSSEEQMWFWGAGVLVVAVGLLLLKSLGGGPPKNKAETRHEKVKAAVGHFLHLHDLVGGH